MSVLAIDAGTTGVTALIVDEQAQVRARGYAEFPQSFPADGWVEHDPEEIWSAVCSAVASAMSGVGDNSASLAAIGLTNQRETLVVWDRRSLRPLRPAIVWQDRRSAAILTALAEAGAAPLVTARTGLRLDPYFTASKATWIARHEPEVWQEVRAGRAVIGTVDSFLLARLSGGGAHLTDASNASRTLLLDIASGTWDDDLCTLFEVPRAALPEVRPSLGLLTSSEPASFLGLRLPVTGLAGDQQASLFGHQCLQPGQAKCTYGTGAFLMQNTGDRIVATDSGLLSTIAWQGVDGRLTYALEGSVFVAGAAVQWLRDGLGLIATAAETGALAASVPDTGGVVFVPALTGLGAPDWDPHARGLIIGLTRATGVAHVVRATLAGIAHSVRDVVELIEAASGKALSDLQVDGGAAANDLLCQMQADLIGRPVLRSAAVESTGLGAALLAGIGAGLWRDASEIAGLRAAGALFPVQRTRAWADEEQGRWREAVNRARGWAATSAGATSAGATSAGATSAGRE